MMLSEYLMHFSMCTLIITRFVITVVFYEITNVECVLDEYTHSTLGTTLIISNVKIFHNYHVLVMRKG